MKNKRLIISGLFILLWVTALITPLFSQDKSDWVSAETVASVVAIGKIYNGYWVVGMPDGHEVTVDFGIPNFGGGTVLEKFTIFYNIGSGVIVSEDGWIFTNWHVAVDNIDVYDRDRNGQYFTDSRGNRIKQIWIPAHPDYIWISSTTPEEVKQSKHFTLKYLAQTITTSSYTSAGKYWGYDMAICKVIKYAEQKGEELPRELGPVSANEKFIYSTMSSPFIIDRINESGASAIGFPGIGPQEMQSITKGDFMGYESSYESIINHSCDIAGGNSGGGFYYKNKLIGINTWSKEDRGNTISKAQPITYFINPVAYLKLMIGEQEIPAIVNLPEIEKAWVQQDPAEKDPYKNQVYLGLELVSASNENRKLDYSFIFFYKNTISAEQAEQFIFFNLQYTIWDWSRILYYDYGVSDDAEVTNILLSIPYIQQFGLDPNDLFNFVKEVRPLDQNGFRNTFKDYEDYINIIERNEFFAELYGADDNGKIMVYAEPNKKYKFTVVYSGFQAQEFDFNATTDLIQGPFKVKVNSQ